MKSPAFGSSSFHRRLKRLVKELLLLRYLDEFTFRFNRRKSADRGKLFYRLAQQAMQVAPVTYSQMNQHISSGPRHKG